MRQGMMKAERDIRTPAGASQKAGDVMVPESESRLDNRESHIRHRKWGTQKDGKRSEPNGKKLEAHRHKSIKGVHDTQQTT